MKIHYILSLAAAGLLFASCSKENMETPEPGEGKDRASFTASVEGSGATRTELGAKDGESYPTLWLSDDRITVTDGTNTGTYGTRDDGTQTATFTYVSGAGVAADADLYAACYPADSYSSYAAGVFRLNLPATQTFKAGNIDNGAYPMVAVSSDTSLRFRNVCGVVRLQLSTSEADLKVESIVLKAQTSLSGAAEIAYDGTGDPVLSCNGSQRLKLACGSGVALGSDPTDFHIVLPPNADGYEELEITVNLAGDRLRTFTANTLIKVERSKITTISLEVDNPLGKALLQSGANFVAAVKTLAAGGDKKDMYDDDMLIKVMKFVPGSAGPKEDGEVEIHDGLSGEPVYLSWDATTETVTVRTSASVISPNRDASYMFSRFKALHTLDLSGFHTSGVTSMSSMFSSCSSLTSLDLSGFDTSDVTDMGFMFNSCGGLTSLDLSGFDTSDVTDISHSFSGCSGLTSLDLSSFDTSSVTNMSHMFYNCSGLISLDLSGFNTSKVTDMSYMFCHCKALTSLDLSSFDTSGVTSMSSMFSSCSSLTSLDLSSFDTSVVTSMSSMFSGCSGLISVDLSSFDTSGVTDMSYIFRSCSSLTSLDLSGFDTSVVTDMEYMFNGCLGLASLNLGRGFVMYNVISQDGMYTNLASTSGNCTITCIEDTKNVISDESTGLDATKVTWELLN